MPTEADYRLEPQDEGLSKVYCNHCDSEIGEVYTASQSLAGRKTGRSEEKVTLEVNALVREHLDKCEKQPSQDPSSYENKLPNTPPEKGPLERRRR